MKPCHEAAGGESAYQSARADAIRAIIFEVIGQKCATCGATSPLEVNHVFKRDWNPKRLSKYRRNLRYLRELRAGVPLTCLCAACNKEYRPKPWPEDPF